jgi:hypothetical protein
MPVARFLERETPQLPLKPSVAPHPQRAHNHSRFWAGIRAALIEIAEQLTSIERTSTQGRLISTDRT